MSGFSVEWLELRRPADEEAISPSLRSHLVAWATQRSAHSGRPLRVVDLGAGSGASYISLAKHLPDAGWRLVDHDAELLETARENCARLQKAGMPQQQTSFLEADLASADLAVMIEEADIVTCSALLDLASPDWLQQLASALPQQAALYAMLTYDGRESWSPASIFDQQALDAFHLHQQQDKGFGSAAGPHAANVMEKILKMTGRQVMTECSDWQLDRINHQKLISALATGSIQAVAETGKLDDVALKTVQTARDAADKVLIGHTDILSLP